MRELKKLEIVTSLATRYTFAHMKEAYCTKLEFRLGAKDIYCKNRRYCDTKMRSKWIC